MEEQDVDALDDFFAKKDKKKKKSKSSKKVADLLPAPTSTPPNEANDSIGDQLADRVAETTLVDSLDPDTLKEKKKSRKKKDKEGSDAASKDEEWHAVTDEVDYSGLRIATKNIAQEAADEAAEAARSEPEYDEDGQIIEKASDGPVWKIPPAESVPTTQEVQAPVAAPVISKMPNVSEGKYVPPSQRNTSALTPVSVKKTTRRKVAPNVNSQEDFPTLGAAPPPVDYDVSNFEKVRGGMAQQPQQQSGQTRLQTSNMYSALERN